MPEGKIALRQLLCLLFAALLSPTVRVLPGRTAAAAGAAGWLCTLTALPVLLGLCWVLFALFRTAGPEDGLAQIFQRGLAGCRERPSPCFTCCGGCACCASTHGCLPCAFCPPATATHP